MENTISSLELEITSINFSFYCVVMINVNYEVFSFIMFPFFKYSLIIKVLLLFNFYVN